jgi:hypothetical protein
VPFERVFQNKTNAKRINSFGQLFCKIELFEVGFKIRNIHFINILEKPLEKEKIKNLTGRSHGLNYRNGIYLLSHMDVARRESGEVSGGLGRRSGEDWKGKRDGEA